MVISGNYPTIIPLFNGYITLQKELTSVRGLVKATNKLLDIKFMHTKITAEKVLCEPNFPWATVLQSNGTCQEPTGPSKQPIRARNLGHVTGYKPIRDQYFPVRSVSGTC